MMKPGVLAAALVVAGCGGGTMGSTDMAGGGGDLAGGGGDLAGVVEKTITNVTGMCDESDLAPDVNEDNHLAAAKLTPPSYPFTVTKVRYFLRTKMGTASCDETLAHRIELYVSDMATPPASPTVAQAFDVPVAGAATMADARMIELPVSPPITIQSPQNLYMAIKFGGKVPNTNCIGTCIGMGKVDNNYWSGAAMPPYSWMTLESFGLDVNLRMEAVGN